MNYRDVLFYKYLHGSGGSQPAWDGATFSSYAKGIEQILPENDADPDSSPFLGDIRYPDGTRRNNYFTYRESPNTVDGQAKITHIKGNTVVFNQLVPTNWASSGGAAGVTYTNNGDGSYTFNGTSTGTRFISISTIVAKANHKYFVNVGNNSNTGLNITINGLGSAYYVKTKGIISISTDSSFLMFYETGASFNNLKVCPQIFDLTQMGLDTLTVDQFTSLYPLPYYDYTQGKLLPFKGESLKTTGKNLIEIIATTGSVIASVDENGYITSKSNFPVAWQLIGSFYAMPNAQYTISATIGFTNGYSRLALGTSTSTTPSNSNPSTYADTDIGVNATSALIPTRLSQTFTSNKDQTIYVWICSDRENTGSYPSFTFACQIEFGSSASSYEPYTSSTINLPTLTYFPTGMKSAGSVYDEITESKAITRVGSVDLGTLDWNRSATSTSGKYAFLASLPNIKTIASPDDLSNIICSKYPTITKNEVYRRMKTGISGATTENIFIYDPNYEDAQDATAFKASLSGQYLYFELATPTEEPISSQTEIQNQALSTILGKTVSVDSPEEPLNILLKGE